MAYDLEALTEQQQKEYSAEIALLDDARAAIERATTIRDAKEVIGRAEALEIYTKRIEYGSILQARCVQIKLRAERKAGELLRSQNLKPGVKPLVQVDDQSTESLAELGVTKNQSSKWQKLASIPVDAFEQAVEDATTESELLRLAKSLEPKPGPVYKAPPGDPEVEKVLHRPSCPITFDGWDAELDTCSCDQYPSFERTKAEGSPANAAANLASISTPIDAPTITDTPVVEKTMSIPEDSAKRLLAWGELYRQYGTVWEPEDDQLLSMLRARAEDQES